MDEVKPEVNASVEGQPPTEVNAPAEPAKTDDRGVPLENVVAELKRKLEDTQVRLSRFEETTLDASPAFSKRVPEEQPKPPVQYDPQADLQEFSTNPRGWTKRLLDEEKERQRQEQQRDRMRQADEFLYEASKGDSRNYRQNAQRVLDVIREYNISFADPLQATRSAWKILGEREKVRAVVSQTEQVKKQEGEVKRQESIRDIQTPSGTKPPSRANKQELVGELHRKATETGNEKDVYSYFRNAVFNDDK